MHVFFLDMTDLANWTCSIVEGQVHRKEGIGSDQMKKAQKKLTLSKIDFLSSVIIIGLD